MGARRMGVRLSFALSLGGLAAVLLCGCASPAPMPLTATTARLDLGSKSIGLFTLRTSNQFKPRFQPSVTWVEIGCPSTEKAQRFRVGSPESQKKGAFYEYLVSVDMAPGHYRLGDVCGLNFVPLLLRASFQFPVNAVFELPPNSILYLGHVSMTNRERKEGERRSGSLVPVLDQAIAGYSTGTFDVTISDRSGTDVPLFMERFPILQDQDLTIQLMTK